MPVKTTKQTIFGPRRQTRPKLNAIYAFLYPKQLNYDFLERIEAVPENSLLIFLDDCLPFRSGYESRNDLVLLTDN